MDKITIEVDDLTKVSDGYHTIEDLYEHRNLLFLTLALELFRDYEVYYRLDKDMEGWFILYIELPSGQISYHLTDNYLEYMDRIPERPEAEWDGHTPHDVLERLHEFIAPKQYEMINCLNCKYFNKIIRPGFGECTNDEVPREKVRQFETCSKGEKK